MRLRRDNTDDPRVEHDLGVLSGAYGDGAVAAVDLLDPASEPAAGAVDQPAGAPVVDDDAPVVVDPAHGVLSGGPFEDVFVRRFVGVVVHLRRYLPYYAGTAAWAALMAAFAPTASHHVRDLEAAPASSASRAAAPVARPTMPPTTAAPAVSAPSYAAPVVDSGDAGIYATLGQSLLTGASSSTEDGSSSTSSSSVTITDGPPPASSTSSSTSASSPTGGVLTISRSGYASSTAGTPAEQDPGDGALPVAAAGGQAMKRSFIALSGTGTILHLAISTATGANVGDAQAHISACPILKSGWSTTRGQAMPGPDFIQPCAVGTRLADGSWTFDLSPFGDPTKEPGFALTADPSDSAASFQVVFQATTLPPPAPA